MMESSSANSRMKTAQATSSSSNVKAPARVLPDMQRSHPVCLSGEIPDIQVISVTVVGNMQYCLGPGVRPQVFDLNPEYP